MKKLYSVVAAAALVIGIGTTAMSPVASGRALNPCDVDPSSSLCSDQGSKGDYKAVVKSVTDIILFIVGAAAVIMIIISAIRYTASAGNQQAVSGAKTTLIYSVVGLLVAVFAYAIAQWVFTTLL